MWALDGQKESAIHAVAAAMAIYCGVVASVLAAARRRRNRRPPCLAANSWVDWKMRTSDIEETPNANAPYR